MATRRRARRVSLKGSILDIQRRLRYVESKPNPFKISDKAITRDALQFNAVSSDQIAPNAVGTEEISSDSITNNELANGSVSNSNLQDGSVGTSNIQDGAVTTPKIADSAVTTDKINNSAVTRAKVASGAIEGRGSGGSGGAAHIATNSIYTQDISDNAITTPKLRTDSVSTVKIENLAVTTTKLAAGAVTTSKISDAQVTLAKCSFSPILSLTAGSAIAISTSGTSRGINVVLGTASTQAARGNHTHSLNFSPTGTTDSLSGVNKHRHTYDKTSSVTASTKKLKKDIQDYTFDINKILKVQLKKFKYLNQAKNKRLNREWEYGYIAEEVQELGLEEVLGYNSNGEPDSINYSILSVFAIELLKQQQKQIDFLTKEIEQLKETK
jgi:hypothetical protein